MCCRGYLRKRGTKCLILACDQVVWIAPDSGDGNMYARGSFSYI